MPGTMTISAATDFEQMFDWAPISLWLEFVAVYTVVIALALWVAIRKIRPIGRKRDVEDDEPPLVEREDGSFLVSGAASADLLSDRLGVQMPTDRDYSTIAGFALSVLKRIPQTGETFSHDGWKFEVVDMDGRKIDKLLASRPKRRGPSSASASTRSFPPTSRAGRKGASRASTNES